MVISTNTTAEHIVNQSRNNWSGKVESFLWSESLRSIIFNLYFLKIFYVVTTGDVKLSWPAGGYHVQVKGLDPPVHLQNRIKKNPKSTKKSIRAINISKKTPVIGSVTISSNWILSLLKLFSLESLILERLSLGLNGNCKICIRFTEENHYFKRSHLQPSHEPKRISYSPVRP